MTAWLPWLAAVVILVSLPALIRWGMRRARGSTGGVAMMLGLAFGHRFDPARAQATETLLKRREQGKHEAAAGEGRRGE
ncbi:hypothetical protein [Sphingomonas sp.]|uniref:hypothetical protein n=1 Tax=Sphingomonas sp. TaxID=28214 RepID=UPI001B1449DB|nr:hypothetical protein [Sphingomonas sp.]MBO9714047.1 hypothetical protein [Sphingomonas sp.]